MSGGVARQEPRSPRGFVSYSRADREPVQRLLRHLSPVAQHEFGVSFWSDSSITAGSLWDHEIANAIAQADIFILCMTADYLASEYLYYREFPAIRKRLDASNGLILPVILKDCAWWGFVGDFQVAPVKNGRIVPISNWHPQENGFHAAAVQITDAIRTHIGLTVTKNEMSPTGIMRRTPRLVPVTPSGPHRVSPDDIDRAVRTVIARRAAKSDV